jgi:hypothetical protein
MRIEAWDAGFVRATRADIHAVLADVAGYGAWWPGVSARPSSGAVALTVRRRLPLRPPRRLLLRVTKDRGDLGLRFTVAGELDGRGEWFYLDEPAGTVVNFVLHAEAPDRGWRAALRDHRAAVRVALHTLKDRFESGRVPGSEPAPALLAAQRAAQAAFAAGVAAHARRIAAGRGLPTPAPEAGEG